MIGEAGCEGWDRGAQTASLVREGGGLGKLAVRAGTEGHRQQAWLERVEDCGSWLRAGTEGHRQ